jgi:hypothetical protein
MTLATAGLRAGITALNGMGASLAACGISAPRLDAESLHRAAIRRAGGLTDFGEWPIEEPFDRLVRAYHDEARLTALGRITVRELLVSLLENLLYLERDRSQNPEIVAEEIAAPVFITGLPRTGTTLLHGLLTEDPTNRVPLTWEVQADPSDRRRASPGMYRDNGSGLLEHPVSHDARRAVVRELARKSQSAARLRLSPSTAAASAVGSSGPTLGAQGTGAFVRAR